MNLDVQRFLEDLSGRYAKAYTSTIEDMMLAKVRDNSAAFDAAGKSMLETVEQTMGIAEVLGATSLLREAAGVLAGDEGGAFARDKPYLVHFADEPAQNILPRVTLSEAVQDMVDRTPTTIRNAAERTALRISHLYSEGRVAAFVRSAEQAVTERAQALVAEAIKEGITENEAGKLITMGVDEIRQKTKAWSESYARMAFRTNLNTAVTAGRFRQAQDEDIKAVIPCFRFDALIDSGTRDNHRAADGFIAKVDNALWRHIAPPLGYSCRCQVSLVSKPQLRRMGRLRPDGSIQEDRLPPGAHADKNFRHGGRPDLFVTEAG